MNIVLIGTMEAGKTTIGKALAEFSGYDFVDTDELAREKMQSKIWNPFSHATEFYMQEDNAISEAARLDRTIIATGAMAVSHKGAISRLRKNGIIVRLEPDLQTVIERFKKDKREILVCDGMSYEEAIKEDYREYINEYDDYDYSISVSNEKTPEEYAYIIWEYCQKVCHGAEAIHQM